MLRLTRPLAVAALGCALALSTSSAALAQEPGTDEREVAVGDDVGNIAVDAADVDPAPDSPTTIAVGGDSNETVPQPDLSSVPTSGGDGVFSAPTGIAQAPTGVIEPATIAAAPAAPVEAAPVEAAPAETAPVEAAPAEAAPAESAPVEAAPVEAAPAAAPAESAPAPGPACGYPSWYDAQLALEADAALAATLDADNDGIACEEAMS
ncbi:MAG: hypothetical protein AVDCRST_MAG59-4028 [uncultured Thermomicrobiales bacterium]|uniref:Excalibur calcium-binding domain-containing protein n=1 Tax=uncultured Thermomicrobiales bacterium TaxID=1645740 RepID=A0A6J4VER5_9BACT|nr:MAG: hypothetical protein AVDCRST_MAG59-4028 [uncultured Thermomicrobiales bacterium]